MDGLRTARRIAPEGLGPLVRNGSDFASFHRAASLDPGVRTHPLRASEEPLAPLVRAPVNDEPLVSSSAPVVLSGHDRLHPRVVERGHRDGGGLLEERGIGR